MGNKNIELGVDKLNRSKWTVNEIELYNAEAGLLSCRVLQGGHHHVFGASRIEPNQ